MIEVLPRDLFSRGPFASGDRRMSAVFLSPAFWAALYLAAVGCALIVWRSLFAGNDD